ncbi:glutathione S-transferase family protein [Pseudorhodobacter ferrugineus]|uniref:glutathione S-transferase family protein n=1 Tax=Pseudorhodobacter ferrugineus TaxID=77008 RepID=UPI0003B3CD58|nr:glutathione S-transferase family protein [Pseudorhodobacter ferrugineus]
MILFSVPHSLYCAKTRILLRAKGLDWHEQPPSADRDLFAKASPFGNLPAILDGDFALSDSEAIAEYLNEAYPTPPMLPDAPAARARMRERGRFHDTRLEPAVRALFPLVAAPNPNAAAQAATAITQRLAQLAILLSHPLPFGLGDCGYAPTFLWIDLLTKDMGLSLDWPPAVRDYRAGLDSLPCVAAELSAYHPHATAWMAEKQTLRSADAQPARK